MVGYLLIDTAKGNYQFVNFFLVEYDSIFIYIYIYKWVNKTNSKLTINWLDNIDRYLVGKDLFQISKYILKYI